MVDPALITKDFADLKIKIHFGEGIPNLEPREDIKITDMGTFKGHDPQPTKPVRRCEGTRTCDQLFTWSAKSICHCSMTGRL